MDKEKKTFCYGVYAAVLWRHLTEKLKLLKSYREKKHQFQTQVGCLGVVITYVIEVCSFPI